MDFEPKDNFYHIHANDLRQRQREKQHHRTFIYNRILEKCYQRIYVANESDQTFLIYQVPEMIMGYPLYNIAYCSAYVIYNLRKNGFQAKFYNPNIIVVQWKHDAPDYFDNQKTISWHPNSKNSNISSSSSSYYLPTTPPIYELPSSQSSTGLLEYQPSSIKNIKETPTLYPLDNISKHENYIENNNDDGGAFIKSITATQQKSGRKKRQTASSRRPSAFKSVDDYEPNGNFLNF